MKIVILLAICLAQCYGAKDLSHGYMGIIIRSGQDLPDMDFGPFNSRKPDAYVIACIQKDNGPIARPITDKSGCDCKTNYIEDETNPTWNHECTNWPKTQLFKNDSRVIFEVWDSDSPDSDDFIGSTSFTIEELVKSRNSGITQSLDIFQNKDQGAEKNGIIWTRVTWTYEHNADLNKLML